MRTTILMGLLLVAIGAMALFQVRNGYFLSMVGQVTYAPPDDPVEIEKAFGELAALESRTPGVTLGDVSAARVACAQTLSGKAFSTDAVRAFNRFNLMLLGVGVDAFTSVVAPRAFRVTELRRVLTHDTAPWPEVEMTPRERQNLDKVLGDIIDAEHPAYLGIDFSSGFTQFDFGAMLEVMLRGGEAFHDCVSQRRSRAAAQSGTG